MTHATLDELHRELRRGLITEADIRLTGGTHLVEGICNKDTDQVFVNPKPSLVEVLLHELIHRRHKRWGEQRVTAEALRLRASMTPSEIACWYRRYQRIATKREKPIHFQKDDVAL